MATELLKALTGAGVALRAGVQDCYSFGDFLHQTDPCLFVAKSSAEQNLEALAAVVNLSLSLLPLREQEEL